MEDFANALTGSSEFFTWAPELGEWAGSFSDLLKLIPNALAALGL